MEIQSRHWQYWFQHSLDSLNFDIAQAELHQHPRQSILTHIACLEDKGCRRFYSILRSRENDRVNTASPEDKWHNELDCILSVDFWNESWKSLSRLKMNNDLKWIAYQIIRNNLKTNVIVSKFIPIVNPSCSFCAESLENVLHLMYECPHVQNFWRSLNEFLVENSIPPLPMSRTTILFGNHDEKPNSLANTLILLGKKFVWSAKFKDTVPRLNIFKYVLRDYVSNLKMVSNILQKEEEFEQIWGLLYLMLSM